MDGDLKLGWMIVGHVSPAEALAAIIEYHGTEEKLMWEATVWCREAGHDEVFVEIEHDTWIERANRHGHRYRYATPEMRGSFPVTFVGFGNMDLNAE